METKTPEDKKDHTDGFSKPTSIVLDWHENITELDISNKHISCLPESTKLPRNLVSLNISQNEVTEVPRAVLILEKLENLDISRNRVKYFDDTPKFCHTIAKLNLSHNSLHSPPHWVWTESPKSLTEVDLSFNPNLTHAFRGENGGEYYEELLEYVTKLTSIKINNCGLTCRHMELLNTFSKVKKLKLGGSALTLFSINIITEVPCKGLYECCDTESLDLSNVQIYTITSKIDVLSKLVEINLSRNEISSLPNEFCNLLNLEICNLSENRLLYLPDNFGNLRKLTRLFLSSNELCMLPETIDQLVNLEVLDLYDNALYDVPELTKQVNEVDLAQNYLDEPQNSYYLDKKEKLRLNLPGRYNGKKIAIERPESEKSFEETDDEDIILSNHTNEEAQPICHDPPSSPEDWDADDYWVPCFEPPKPKPSSYWLYYVKRKMQEGNFCPMDMHAVSIAEKVKYEKLSKCQVMYESDGQFDDYSDDNS